MTSPHTASFRARNGIASATRKANVLASATVSAHTSSLTRRPGGRVEPQELELPDAAEEQGDEVVGGDHEREVARAVARTVHRTREAGGDGEEEDQREHAARPTAPSTPALRFAVRPLWRRS